MNHKVLVEIFVPASGESYDVFIPLESRMSEVVELVSEAIGELTGGRYLGTRDSLLCDRESGMIYNMNMAVAELGIENGTRLMLI